LHECKIKTSSELFDAFNSLDMRATVGDGQGEYAMVHGRHFLQHHLMIPIRHFLQRLQLLEHQLHLNQCALTTSRIAHPIESVLVARIICL
jgi:hypothetical protein